MTRGPAPTSILYVITDLLTGGVPLHLHRLCRAMRDRGFHPEVFCLAGEGPVSSLLRGDGLTVHHGGALGPWDLRALLRLVRTVRARRPAIVHAFLFHANIAARIACALDRHAARRLICEIQTVEIERRWHLWVDGFTQELCRFEVGNSPSVVQHLIDRAHLQPARVRLVRGGIDPDAIDGAPVKPRAHWGLPADRPLVVWAGRLDPVKGLDDLLEALALLPAGERPHLALAGDGEYRPHLEGRIDELRLESCASLLGRRDDVTSLLHVADVFAFPSYTEGLPNALLEAMAARRAVVATDVPGCRDLVEHEQTGLLVPPRSPPALARALSRLLSEAPLRTQLGKEGRRRVEQLWHVRDTYAAYELLYREIMAEPPA